MHNKIGLIINDKGIYDNVVGSELGLIEWNNIRGISTAEVDTNVCILIEVRNPYIYFENVKPTKKRIIENNFNVYGSPVLLNVKTLDYDFRKLQELLKSELNNNKYRNKIGGSF